MSNRVRRAGVIALICMLLCGTVEARAADAGGSVGGQVRTPNGQPVASATVTLDGPEHRTLVSDGRGAFTFGALAAGVYSVSVAKPGFDRLSRADVVVTAGARAGVDVTLIPSSFSSLQTIGRVTSNANGKIAINTTTAAAQTISTQAFLDQGQTQVTKLLEETPGVSMTSVAAGGGANRASEGAPVYPQLRGALHYETESLIDGHPVSVGSIGTFNPLLVLPGLLDSIEVVKGPGAMPTEVNYAIGGTVNYRTLEPTRTPVTSVDLDVDRYGGVDTTLRATGSLADHKVDYAFGYATLGSPGPLQNYQMAGSQLFLAFGGAPWTINGQAVAGVPVAITPSPYPQYVGGPGSSHFSEPLYTCCFGTGTDYNARGQLGKVRLNFSEQTALTLSYIGGQSYGDYTGIILGSTTPLINFSTFNPPAGYSGSVPAGTPIPFDSQANTSDWEFLQQNLFQAELRSAIGDTTLLARAYSGFDNTFVTAFTPGVPLDVTLNTWGGIALCPPGDAAKGAGCVTPGGAAAQPVTTYFNGAPATFTNQNPASYTILMDHVRGYSFEADRPLGAGLLSVAIDRSNHDSWSSTLAAASGLTTVPLPPGSGQQFTTAMLRAQLPFAPRVSAQLATYFTWYASHYTGDGGVTWQDATHAQTVPRLGLAWRPDADSALRFAAGGSIAPPYISLLSSPGTTPVHDPAGAAQGYFINANNGQIAPEKAFGFDLGYDRRLLPQLRLSTDVYWTHLRDMFLTETSQQGTYTATTGASAGVAEPLYVTQTANLGNARFEGIEAELDSAPPSGIGFKLQGSLQRAYAYGLTPAFYSTTAGPYTTNLGVIPDINFQASGNGFNAISQGRIPYSQGYAELNVRGRNGNLFLAGWTYFGPNNAYNQPAFGVLSASVRVPISRNGWVQLSADNITGVYAQPYAALLAGVPVPLVNGKLGVVAGSNYGPPTVVFSLHEAVR